MFKDYYAILEISFPSDEKEIKTAYRKQSLKWHPDRNPGKNTEDEMKSVNEAYTILSKPDLKRKYDAEYTVFRKQKRSNQNITTRNTEETYNKQPHYKQWEYAYDVKDENLKHDINNARKSSEEYVKAFMASLKTDAKSAAKGALKGALPYIISGVILLVFTLFVQMCS